MKLKVLTVALLAGMTTSQSALSGSEGQEQKLMNQMDASIEITPKGEVQSWKEKAKKNLSPYSHDEMEAKYLEEANAPVSKSVPQVRNNPEQVVHQERHREPVLQTEPKIDTTSDADGYLKEMERAAISSMQTEEDALKDYALSMSEELNPKGYDSRMSITDWHIHRGATLKGNLQEWAEIEGWTVIWDTTVDMDVGADASYSGNFLVALNKLFTNLSDAGSNFSAKAYKGNKVLRVWHNLKHESSTMVE